MCCGFGAQTCKVCVLEGNIERPWKDWLWDGASRLVLASFAKRLCDQQGVERAHYLVKAGRGVDWKSFREKVDNWQFMAQCLVKQASETGKLTQAYMCAYLIDAGFFPVLDQQDLKKVPFCVAICCFLNHVLCVVKDCGLPALETTTTYRDWLVVEHKPAGLVSAWFHVLKTCQMYSPQDQESTCIDSWWVTFLIVPECCVWLGRTLQALHLGIFKPWALPDYGIPNSVGSPSSADWPRVRQLLSSVSLIGPTHDSRSRLVLVLWLAQR